MQESAGRVVDLTGTPLTSLAASIAALSIHDKAVIRGGEYFGEVILQTLSRDIINGYYQCDVEVDGRLWTPAVALKISSSISDIHTKRIWRNYMPVSTVEAAENPELLCPMCGQIGWHQEKRKHPETQLPGFQWTCVKGLDGWWAESTKRDVRALINEDKRNITQKRKKIMRDRSKKMREGEKVTYVMSGADRAARGRDLIRKMDAASRRRKIQQQTREQRAAEKERLNDERRWRREMRGTELKERKLDQDTGECVDSPTPIGLILKLKLKCGDTVNERFIDMTKVSQQGKSGDSWRGGAIRDTDNGLGNGLRPSSGTTYKLRTKERDGGEGANANHKSDKHQVAH